MRRWAYRCKTVQKYLNRQKLLNGLNAESSESPLNAYSMLGAFIIIMKIETINQANKIIHQIKKIDSALGCFYREERYGENDEQIEEVDLKPTLFVEHLNEEYEGRRMTEIPIALNRELIAILKSHLEAEKEKLELELDAL